MTRWSLRDGVELVERLGPLAHALGWLVAMYGSTLTAGDGRDLDLVMVPWRRGTQPEDVKALLASTWGAVEIGHAASAYDQSLGAAYQLPDGRVIDVLYVRRVDARDVI